MPTNKHSISIPILTPPPLNESSRIPSGGLASGTSSRPKSAATALELVTLDQGSLAKTIDAVQLIASDIKSQVASSHSISLSELQIEVGISATGKVGIIGFGADLQCAAKLQLKFRVE